MQDPVEVQPPGRGRLPVVLRVKKSRGHVPFTPLDDIPLDLGHSPAVVGLVGEPPGVV